MRGRRGHLLCGLRPLEPRVLFFGGDLDPSFWSDGMLPINWSTGEALAVQSDGKVIVEAQAAGLPKTVTLHRYTAGGAMDNTFDADGIATISFEGVPETISSIAVNDIAVQADGKILVVGTAFYAQQGYRYGVVARFNANGSPDNSFSGDARLVIAGVEGVNSDTRFDSIEVRSNGQIVIGGTSAASLNSPVQALAICRLNANGTFDNGFSGNGQVLVNFGESVSRTSVSIAGNGQVVFGATKSIGSDAFARQFVYGRLNTDGALDGDFSDDGFQVTPFVSAYEYNSVSAVLALPDNKVMVVGQVGGRAAESRNVGVLRLNVDGSRDVSFGQNNGRAEFEYDVPGVQDVGNAIALSATGKYLIGGASNAGPKVVLLNTDGSRDYGFAGDGLLEPPLIDCNVQQLAIAPGGKVVASLSGSGISGTAAQLIRFEDRANVTVGMFTLNGTMNEQGQTSVSVVVTRAETLPVATQVFLNITGSAVYPIEGVLNQPIDYTGTGITFPGEFVSTPYVTIPANAKSTFFTLTTVDDTRLEGLEVSTFWIADTGAYDAFAPRSVTLLIQDNDTVGPLVTSRSFQFETAPQRVQFTFNEDVGSSATASDFTFTSSAGTVPARTLSYNAATRTATLTFAGGALPDGNYTVTLPANRVTNTTGQSNPTSTSLSFHVLAGDANRDRVVNFDDLLMLASNYNTTGKTFTQGDFSYDSGVNFDDLLILAARYNTSLVGATPSPVSFRSPGNAIGATGGPNEADEQDDVPDGGSDLLG